MTQASHRLGRQGEKIAHAILRQKGFRIEAVNWRAGQLGEIDLVAYHPQRKLLAFVEVKTRKGDMFGVPGESVHGAKQAKLLALAEAYLGLHPQEPDTTIRFDVVGVLFPGGGKPAEIAHLENAFGDFG